MRIGVIGLGSIGRRHVGNLLALGCRPWIYDIAPKAGPDAPPGCSFTNRDWDVFDNVEAVVIATPWDQHLRYVEQAIERGMPFMVEKPLGSLEQLPRWRAIAALDLPINQVGYQLRFHPEMLRLRQCVPQAEVGHFTCGCDARTWPGRAYGPMLLEMSHEIDLALWCGAPTDRIAGWTSEHQADISFGPYSDRWSVYLFDRAPDYSRTWYLAGGTDRAEYGVIDPLALGVDMYREEMAHFLHCVRTQTPTRVPLSEGLKVLEVCAQVEALCPSSV